MFCVWANVQILSPSQTFSKFSTTLLLSTIVLLTRYLSFKNNSLQIECVVDNCRLLLHLMPMQILTDIEHKLNVVLVHTPNAFSFMLCFGFIWFTSKKVLARLEIKTLNKNKASWIVLCLFSYRCIDKIPMIA